MAVSGGVIFYKILTFIVAAVALTFVVLLWMTIVMKKDINNKNITFWTNMAFGFTIGTVVLIFIGLFFGNNAKCVEKICPQNPALGS